MGQPSAYTDKLPKKTTHAVTARGAKIVRLSKDGSWRLERGKIRMPLSVSEAACIASTCYVYPGRYGGEEFDLLVNEFWSRKVHTVKKKKKKKAA